MKRERTAQNGDLNTLLQRMRKKGSIIPGEFHSPIVRKGSEKRMGYYLSQQRMNQIPGKQIKEKSMKYESNIFGLYSMCKPLGSLNESFMEMPVIADKLSKRRKSAGRLGGGVKHYEGRGNISRSSIRDQRLSYKSSKQDEMGDNKLFSMRRDLRQAHGAYHGLLSHTNSPHPGCMGEDNPLNVTAWRIQLESRESSTSDFSEGSLSTSASFSNTHLFGTTIKEVPTKCNIIYNQEETPYDGDTNTNTNGNGNYNNKYVGSKYLEVPVATYGLQSPRLPSPSPKSSISCNSPQPSSKERNIWSRVGGENMYWKVGDKLNSSCLFNKKKEGGGGERERRSKSVAFRGHKLYKNMPLNTYLKHFLQQSPINLKGEALQPIDLLYPPIIIPKVIKGGRSTYISKKENVSEVSEEKDGKREIAIQTTLGDQPFKICIHMPSVRDDEDALFLD